MNKIAALDLGSNTFLCLIAEFNDAGQYKVLEDQVRVVRLGQGMSQTKRFDPEALKRAKETLNEFKGLILKHQVSLVSAVATAAARDAENKEELVQICDDLEIPMRIISGDEEARISFAGGVSGLKATNEPILVIDCGGRSTEVVVGSSIDAKKKIDFAKSLPLGGVQLSETFIKKYPITDEQFSKMKSHIDQTIKQELSSFKSEWPKIAVAVAGAPTELAKATIGKWDPERIDGFFLTQKILTNWIEKFRTKTPSQIITEFGIDKGRADVILAGTLVIRAVLEAFNLDGAGCSIRGIRYGELLDFYQRQKGLK